ACGEEDEAIELASAHLEDYLADPNRRLIGAGSDYYSMWLTIRLLGDSGDVSVLEPVEAGTYGDSFRGRYVTGLQGAAIMAYAKLAAENAIERLRELYASNDYYVRIAAAVSLYYLGDDSGYDLLEHFVNHTERSIPAIEARWHVDMHGGKPFHEAILYLRSPLTEDLFLERLRNGVGNGDKEALAIARSHQPEILPVLVEHLNSRGRTTRKNANQMLRQLTGKDFGFDPGKFAFRQAEAIEQWRSYIEHYPADTLQHKE
ncbi:MAG: HEAT repeat domain-containing protein, partial [Planctomycetota bacterium]